MKTKIHAIVVLEVEQGTDTETIKSAIATELRLALPYCLGFAPVPVAVTISHRSSI